MNKTVKSINSPIDISTKQRDTCMNELKDGIGDEIYKECSDSIKRVRESRHTKILDRQINKLSRLCQQTRDGHSKQQRWPHKA